MPAELNTQLRSVSGSTASQGKKDRPGSITVTQAANDARQVSSVREETLPVVKDGKQVSGQESKPLKDGNVSETEANKVVDNLNTQVQNLRRELRFSLSKDDGDVVIQVIDSESKQTIRTIPSEEIKELSQSFVQQTGSLISTSV